MVGCMVGTSLAMAPAMLLAPRARFVDLDGPLLLARDREHGLRYEGSLVYPPAAGAVGLSARASRAASSAKARPAAASGTMAAKTHGPAAPIEQAAQHRGRPPWRAP